MKNIILTSKGIVNLQIAKHLLTVLRKPADESKFGIIVNGADTIEEKAKKAEKRFFRAKLLGFKLIDIIDLELFDVTKLEKYDCIEIAGGNPFRILSVFKRTKADQIITKLGKSGKIVIGASGGSFVLSPNLNFINFIEPKLNYNNSDLSALNLFPNEIFPHFDSYWQYNSKLEKSSKEYERINEISLIKINDDQAVYMNGDKLVIEAI